MKQSGCDFSKAEWLISCSSLSHSAGCPLSSFFSIARGSGVCPTPGRGSPQASVLNFRECPHPHACEALGPQTPSSSVFITTLAEIHCSRGRDPEVYAVDSLLDQMLVTGALETGSYSYVLLALHSMNLNGCQHLKGQYFVYTSCSCVSCGALRYILGLDFLP